MRRRDVRRGVVARGETANDGPCNRCENGADADENQASQRDRTHVASCPSLVVSCQ